MAKQKESLRSWRQKSFPRMRFVKIDAMRAQQRLKLIFKRLLSMMRLLIPDIFSHALNLRFANREGAESGLPAKSSSGFPLCPA
jgi:hypothetical protein